MDQTQAVQVLLAKQEIYEALMRYCRGVDRGDGDLMRSASHEDAFDDHGVGGRALAWDMAKAYGDSEPVWEHSQHTIGNCLIEVDGDTAASEAYVTCVHRFSHADIEYDFVIAGRYVDRWERRGGAFRIAHRTAIWDWVRTDPVDAKWPGPDAEVPKSHWGGEALSTVGARWGQFSKDDYSYQVIKGRV
jgi:hypothetical protein